MYEWDINVRHWNNYGDAVASTTPTKVLGKDRAEVTEKVRAMYNARYDDFRKCDNGCDIQGYYEENKLGMHAEGDTND